MTVFVRRESWDDPEAVDVPTEAEFDKLQKRVAELETILTSLVDLHSVVARLRNRLEDEQ